MYYILCRTSSVRYVEFSAEFIILFATCDCTWLTGPFLVLPLQYIRSAMLKPSTPKLMVKNQSDLLQDEEEDFRMPSVYANLDDTVIKTQLHSFGPSMSEVQFISTWDVKSNYSIKIMQATHVNVTENHKVHTFTLLGLMCVCCVVMKAFVAFVVCDVSLGCGKISSNLCTACTYVYSLEVIANCTRMLQKTHDHVFPM